jgi:hypothetical protein
MKRKKEVFRSEIMRKRKSVWIVMLLMLLACGAASWPRRGRQMSPAEAAARQSIIDARTFGLTPENEWNKDFDAGEALNKIHERLTSPGTIVNLSGAYYFHTPVRWIDKRVRCDAFVDLMWTGKDGETCFTFGGSKGRASHASQSMLSGIQILGDGGKPTRDVTAWRFENVTDCTFTHLAAACCRHAFVQWSTAGDYSYFNKFVSLDARYGETAFTLAGEEDMSQPEGSCARLQQSTCSQFYGFDVSAMDVLFDLREGANEIQATGVTYQTPAKNPVIVRTGKTGGRSRIQLAYFEAGGKGLVEFNNDHNRLFYNDAWHVIQWQDGGRDNQFLQQ